MFVRQLLTNAGLLLTLCLCSRWPSCHQELCINHGAQHPLDSTASEMALSDEDHVQIVHRSPSSEVRELYDAFINKHGLILHLAMAGQRPRPGFSLSLVYFEDISGGGNWGLLIIYETMTEKFKHKIRHYLQRPRPDLRPLDPSTDRFLFAIAPRMRFGRFLSAHGNIQAPKVTGNSQFTLTGALYISSDPNHSGSTATIGGTIVSIDEHDNRRHHALTLCTVWDGLPATIDRSQEAEGQGQWREPFQAPVIERGRGEVLLEPLQASDPAITSDELDPIPADHYQDGGSAATDLGGEIPIRLDYPTSMRGIPWCLVNLDDEANYPSANTLSSGEVITLSETEPTPGSVLYVATAEGFEALPRCTLLDLPMAWIEVPYTIGPSMSRQFQLLPGSRESTWPLIRHCEYFPS